MNQINLKKSQEKNSQKIRYINIIFLMDQNISIQEYNKIILYLYQLKNPSNILVTLLKFICGNLMKCHWKVLKKFISLIYLSLFQKFHLQMKVLKKCH